MQLSTELRSSKKGLTNIKNNDQKCFLCCHIRDINPVKNYTKGQRVCKWDYDEIKFSVSKKDFSKIETKNNVFINVFC